MNEAENHQTTAPQIWSGERLTAEMDALDLKQKILSQLAGPSPTVLSWWENGVRMPSRKHAQRVQKTIEGLKRLVEIHGEDFDVNGNVRKISRQLRQIGSGPKQIPQVTGSDYLNKFCRLAEMKPAHIVAAAQMPATIIHATNISAFGQDWLLMWTSSIEGILQSKPFSEFVAKNGGDERKALTLLANQAFEKILSVVGREKVLALMASLLSVGELKAASQASVSKN